MNSFPLVGVGKRLFHVGRLPSDKGQTWSTKWTIKTPVELGTGAHGMLP